jgi:AdoMet-dependent rRNA methyltransferase SPB1
VGVSWEQDAYTQNELVLSALKMATTFLRKDGVFVTKVFRSVDYNSLLWVFNKLFDSVTATKPVASRTASAEIFVVCSKFTAPKSIDPKLLDPRFVFMESEDVLARHNVNSIKQIIEGKRVKIDYSKGLAQFRKASLNDFLNCSNPFQFLADTNFIDVNDEESQKIVEIIDPGDNIRDYFKDIKLLGLPELKALVKYRNRALARIEKKDKKEQVAVEENSDEELQDMIDQAQRKEKRKTKKQAKLEKKLEKGNTKLNDVYEGQQLFTLQDPEIGKADLEELEYTDPEDQEDEIFYSDEGSELEMDEEGRIQNMEASLQVFEDEKIKKRRKISDDDEVVVEQMIEESMKKEAAARWYQRDEFANIDKFQERIQEASREDHRPEEDFPEEKSKKDKKKKKRKEKAEKNEKEDFMIVPQEYPEANDPEALAETIALGTAMLRKKRRREIIDKSYNKYNFDDEKLPDWFEKDQKKFYTPPLPVSRAELAEARKQVQQFTKRSTKKVMEAIARKKRRLSKKLDSLKPKAEAIANQTDISESIKVKQLQKLYKKEINNHKPQKKYIVSRNFHKDRKSLRKGGRNIRFVDKRLKKDKRALKKR